MDQPGIETWAKNWAWAPTKDFPSNWMGQVPGTLRFSQMTLPGTHDTCSLYGGDLVICQTMSLQEQLEAGIRFLDIRCGHDESGFPIYHNFVYQNLYFDTGVRDVCIRFLDAHPSECLIMSIHWEHGEEKYTRTFEETFDWYLKGYEKYWYLDDTLSTLEEVRGKIVLFRRFPASRVPKGINAWDNWSSTFTIPGSTVLHVQDQYEVPTIFAIEEKSKKVTDLLTQAAQPIKSGLVQPGANDWYINFASGSSGGAYPNAVAKGSLPITQGVNTNLLQALNNFRGPTRLGTILMDFPEYPANCLISALVRFGIEGGAAW